MDFQKAAASQVAFSTAWHVLMTRGGLSAGQSVLIHAAGSGIGSAALQIARLAGARIIASSSSDTKLRRARDWADEVVNYSVPEWPEQVLDLTHGAGVDLVMSHAGGDEFRGSLRAVRDDGIVVVVGGHAKEVVDIDLVSLFRRQLRIIGSSRATQVEIRKVIGLVAQGILVPTVHSVLPLSEAAVGHRVLADRQAYGKILLTP
jgi:NADPH:quinone reductase-like Zn-dependent oxidoreductase